MNRVSNGLSNIRKKKSLNSKKNSITSKKISLNQTLNLSLIA